MLSQRTSRARTAARFLTVAIHLGILLALLSALATSVAALLKHRGACDAPDLRLRNPIGGVIGLFRSKWFTIGMLVALAAWVLHVGAIALAPLSLVRMIASSGLVLLTVLADRIVGCTVGRRQWAGVALTAIGLALLAATFPGHDSASSTYSRTVMIAFQASLLAAASALALTQWLTDDRRRAALLGIAAGMLLGACEIALKALTRAVALEGPLGLLSPLTPACLIAAAIAFYSSASALQTGEALPVLALTTIASTVSSISGGIVVFGEPLPNDATGIAAQGTAAALMLVATALIPPAPRLPATSIWAHACRNPGTPGRGDLSGRGHEG